MQVQTAQVIKVTEQEIVGYIEAHFGIDYESIVAMEEIGNQYLTKTVSPATSQEIDCFLEEKEEGYMYKLGTMLDILCSENVIPAGEYIIDCTW